MSTRYGTSHFVTRAAACRYYAKQGITPQDVANKINAGEITIGEPLTLAAPGRVRLDADGRYWIEEERT